MKSKILCTVLIVAQTCCIQNDNIISQVKKLNNQLSFFFRDNAYKKALEVFEKSSPRVQKVFVSVYERKTTVLFSQLINLLSKESEDKTQDFNRFKFFLMPIFLKHRKGESVMQLESILAHLS